MCRVFTDDRCSNSLNKSSRPSRAYLHLTQQAHVNQLAVKISSTSFDDAAGTARDVSLSGPPFTEMAPYGRVPNNKIRKDQRQGTIDQDPEFISFLEDLTNPSTKSGEPDQENETTVKGKDKVISTPLIDYLREKKANKIKDVTSAKSGKHGRQESKDSKSASVADKKLNGKAVVSSVTEIRTAQAIKVENAAREAARIVNKPANTPKLGEQSARPPAATTTPSKSGTINPLAEKKRERGVASAAARILQRDLGIGGARGTRGGRRSGASQTTKDLTQIAQAPTSGAIELTPASSKESNAGPKLKTSTSSPTPLAPGGPAASQDPPAAAHTGTKVPPTGPAKNRVQNPTALSKAPVVSPTAPKPAHKTQVSLSDSTSKQAFLKHANPSQGVTEPLLEEAFAVYGKVQKVEIDKKKGFAYIDFEDPQGLLKALQASPVKIGQGQVVVLERKIGPNLQMRNARGGGPPPRGGGPPQTMRGGRGGAISRCGRPRAPLPTANTNIAPAHQNSEPVKNSVDSHAAAASSAPSSTATPAPSAQSTSVASETAS